MTVDVDRLREDTPGIDSVVRLNHAGPAAVERLMRGTS